MTMSAYLALPTFHFDQILHLNNHVDGHLIHQLYMYMYI